MDSKIMLVAGVVVFVIVIVAVIVLVAKSGHKARTKSQAPSRPVLVPSGAFPADGRKFVIRSTATGNYIGDGGLLTSDISKAKVLTYNSKLEFTNESIAVPSGQNNNEPTQLAINIVPGSGALVGSTSTSSTTGSVIYGIIVSGQQYLVNGHWTFGMVNGYPSAALAPQYHDLYSVAFYYV